MDPVLAHELRNPLAPIRNGLQLLKLTSDPSIAGEAIAVMERQLNQMVRLVDDLLDINRINRNKLELRKTRVDLASIVQCALETARPQIEAKGHKLTITLPSSPVYLDGDLTRLAQVFCNLLNNSAKYTESGGLISLTAQTEGDEVSVTVRDNGIGIPADSLPSLFAMFSQVDRNLERAEGGLGIGLALVQGLVDAHCGRVSAQSDGPGHGSTFIVHLPIAKTEAHVEHLSQLECKMIANHKILVVDDNRDAASSLAMLLRVMGNETRAAHDGLQALELAEAFRPDLIIMDIGMPKLNGYDTCRRIRDTPWGKGILLVAVTGWNQEEDRRRSKDAGFDHHIVKPIDSAALRRLITDGLECRSL
jgi:CheY-like chemotaxis protein